MEYMKQYEHLLPTLAQVWDEVHSVISKQYSLADMEKVFVDTVALGTDRNPACYYDGNIVVDPSVFTLKDWYSDYTGLMSDKPLHFILSHEACHFLQHTNQIELEADLEAQADNFAYSIIKEMK